MAQQKSEDRVLLEGGVMPVEPSRSSVGGQGKAIPVDQTAWQLRLPIATADDPQGAKREASLDRSGVRDAMVPKAVGNAEDGTPVTMEEVAYRLTAALVKVVSNRGVPGPDGQTVGGLREQWPVAGPRLAGGLLDGSYRPGVIRRANIPKAGGGQRGLGIPNVIDRVVCEAVRQVLEPVFEPTFHPSSHGFRPGRSCHTAIEEASGHLEDGYGWVVDIDLEKFFDRVCHQRLMSRLAQRVGDRRLLVLIGRLLKAKIVLSDGVVIGNEEGVPQGAPLSPLLSNVVLDELDWELDRRGHRFVRYADDGNVYVKTERAGQRVMASLTTFHRRALAPEDQPSQVGGRLPRRPPLPRFPAAVRPAVAGRGDLALAAHKEQRDAADQAAHTAILGRHACELHPQGQRVAARVASVLRDRLARRAVHVARARRSYPASAPRDRAAPLEAPPDDRSQPHRPRCQAKVSMAGRLLGTQVPVGAESHPASRSSAAAPVLHRPRTRLACEAAPPRAPGDRRSHPRTVDAGVGIDRGRQAAGGGVDNPPSRRAVCEQRKHGSVGAGAGNRPGYPTGVAAIDARRLAPGSWNATGPAGYVRSVDGPFL